MAQLFSKMTSEARHFLYTKLFGMNEENTLSFEELLEKTARISMDQRVINGGKTQGYATEVTVLDPKSTQEASTTETETPSSGEEKSPVERFNEQRMISGNSSFFMTVPGTELPEEVYSLTAAQSELQYAQGQGIKFFKHVDKDGVAQYFRAGKVRVKVDKKFGEVGKSIYEKLAWPKGMTADSLGNQRPILVNRDVRENMPEGIYGSLKLDRTHPNLVPIITAALSIGLAAAIVIGGPKPDPNIDSRPDDTPPQDEIVLVIDKEDEETIEDPVVKEQDGVALGNVFKLNEGVKAFYTAKEALVGQNDQGNGVAVIGNKYCSPEDSYYIDGLAVLDKDGTVIDTNFKTYGLTREEYIKAVAEEKGLNPEDLTGIVHYSKVGEGVSLNENGDMVYDGSSNTGWVNQATVTDGEKTSLEGAELQGNLEGLNMLKFSQDLGGQTGGDSSIELGQ